MNKIIFGLLISSGLSVNTYAVCTYNFDATQAQVNAKNAAGGRQIKLMSPISIAEQKVRQQLLILEVYLWIR
ncbi:hypothetical protein [Acinetobacter calcoaceticus]|uniref:hypothetical protein n=1 Tax=Acinetobacter calcoaceticus TaxID=471 RepID=UPI002862539E|nr:hypothetical protein [Acinetobacter calcoaceticus]MDR6796467.1 hypothetical protein [Acinetobacter calcoaceticus]